MSASRSGSLSELARHGFQDLSESAIRLEQLAEMLGTDIPNFLPQIAKSASPDAALKHLLELANLKQKQLAEILAVDDSGQRLCRLLGASDGLAQFIFRFPNELENFERPAGLPSNGELAKAFDYADLDLAKWRLQIRKTYRSHLLRIVDWDLSQPDFRTAIGPATRALSDLAGQALNAALTLSYAELRAEGRFSLQALDETKLAIIGMGKCGARELNYVSDVDVIFVYQGEHEVSPEVATRLANRTMRNIDEPGIEPALWQVDANLRPEGKSGALVRTLESHLSYYQKWAENWEFQALLKARPIAGDLNLGARYMESVASLTWSRGERNQLVENTRRMRQRVLENIPVSDRDFEIKLGRGGLRDIEFTVQLLQLVHGVAYPSVRVADTLSALDALANEGLIGRADRDRFIEDYQFLRALEHRVQLSKMRRDHLLPKDEDSRRRVARGLGAGMSLSELDEMWQLTRARVAKLHDAVFYKPLLNAMATIGPEDVRLTDAEVTLRLEAIGFTNPSGAISHLAALTQGVSRRAAIQRTLLPVLLRWLAEGVNPDRGLLAFRRLSESLGETHWFLRMLRDSSGAAERLMRVLSSSEFVTKLLEHTPESSEWFTDPANLRPREAGSLRQEFESIRARSKLEDCPELYRGIRRRETLRLAIGAVLGELTIEEIAFGLSEITDLYLLAMLELARSLVAADAEFEFGIVAMGRLGGQEIGFGSDADAMLVYRSHLENAQQTAEKLASQLMLLVKDPLLGFELDLDLRPEGKQGVRVRSLDSYAAYYARWSDIWEFQALLRARPIGSDKLAADFKELIDSYRYPVQLSNQQLIEIRRIKARVETERLPKGADPARHLKLGRGSISDVEWLVQLYQLRFAYANPTLRTLSTPQTIQALEQAGFLSSDQRAKLEAAWRLSSRVRSGLVLALDRSNDQLPSDRNVLEAIARILGYEPGNSNQLEEDYLALTRRARAVYEELFTR